MSESERSGAAGGAAGWDGGAVRGLRRHVGESQAAFARRIGTRQQTISEWETGSSRPRRMSRRLLHLVAEETGFYRVEEGVDSLPEDAAGDRAP